ncbi:MAG: flagellar hook-length control protein FliK [Syntrophomonadaceae bacterium]|nr:flagellar hook-length control protein FliK [Syntrophomonadaceae bacterium]HQD89450.1 flagellar hook-length control protein FliK [Syntrophomonadaceae bacterium]
MKTISPGIIFKDVAVAAKPPEAIAGQVKSQSPSQESFSHILEKTHQCNQNRTPSSGSSNNGAEQGSSEQDMLEAGDLETSQTAEEMTVVAGFSGAPEAPNPDLKEALLPTISASSLNSSEVGHSGLPVTGDEATTPRHAQHSGQLGNSPPPATWTVSVAAAEAIMNPTTGEGQQIVTQFEENRVSPSLTQTGPEAQPLTKQEPWFSSVPITREAEAQNPEQSKIQAANHKHQVTRELAEWENGKLTGQKANVKVNTMQAASSPEQNQVGRDSQNESLFLSNRSETPVFRFYELNNQVTSKAESPAPKMDFPELLEQIVRKAELLLRQNSSQMKIQLEPEFLGKLTIKVMVEEGVVTARFITESYQVKQMLEANLGSLRHTLESHGMRVERAEVDVQLNNGGLFEGSEGQDKWNWNQQYPPNLAGSSLREGSSYDYDDFQYVQADLAVDENYGILANGGLNFLV